MATVHRPQENCKGWDKFRSRMTKRTTSPTNVCRVRDLLSLNRSTGSRPWPPYFRRQKWLDDKTVVATTDSFFTTRAHTKDFEELGYRLHTRTRHIMIATTNGTGCQTVLVGIKIIHRLCLKRLDFVSEKRKRPQIVTSAQFLGQLSYDCPESRGQAKY